MQQATELEEKMCKLFELTRFRVCRSTNYGGLEFKVGDTYITEDGYPIGSYVWYMRLLVRDYRFMVYGRKPEDVVEKAIEVFKAFTVSKSDAEFFGWLKPWLKKEFGLSAEIARWV